MYCKVFPKMPAWKASREQNGQYEYSFPSTTKKSRVTVMKGLLDKQNFKRWYFLSYVTEFLGCHFIVMLCESLFQMLPPANKKPQRPTKLKSVVLRVQKH